MAPSSVIDWVAIAEVLTAGEAFGDDYPVPGAPLPREIPIRHFRQPTEQFTGSWEQAQDTCDSLIRAAIERSPSHWDFAIGLSGGHDSRHLLLATRAVGRSVSRAVCAEHWQRASTAADTAAARLLAHRLGIPLEIASQSPDRYAAEWDKNLLVNLTSTNHSWVLALARHMGNAQPILDGLNGGGLMCRDPLTVSWVDRYGDACPSADQAVEHVRDILFRHPRRRVSAWLSSPRLTPSIWREAEDRLVERFRRYLDYPNPFQAWIYLERTRRAMALVPYVLMGNDRVLCPYYDEEVGSFGLSLPWDITCRREFQEQMLARIYPDVADVPLNHRIEVRQTEALSVDPEAERRSLARIVPLLDQHVNPDWLAKRYQPAVQGRGNRRMVLVAEALAWEDSGRPGPLGSPL